MRYAFYEWVLAELSREGYEEKDIVLVSSDSQHEILMPAEFKELTNIAVNCSSGCRDTIPLVSFDKFYIHLKDGSIAVYDNLTQVYDRQGYENSIYIIKSIGAVGGEAKMNLIPHVVARGQDDSFAHQEGINGFFKGSNVLTTSVTLIDELVKDQYYVIMSRHGYLQIVLSTIDKRLGIAVDHISKEDIPRICEHFKLFPVEADEKFKRGLDEQLALLVP